MYRDIIQGCIDSKGGLYECIKTFMDVLYGCIDIKILVHIKLSIIRLTK